jgi:hypothetical protein
MNAEARYILIVVGISIAIGVFAVAWFLSYVPDGVRV